MDESSFVLMHYLTHIWFPKGKRPTKRYAFDHKTKIFAFGALTFDKVITKITSSPNSKNFEKFLEKLRRISEKLVIILDNVSSHFTKRLKKFYAQHKIVVIPLPKYSPQLNPIELFWRAVKAWIGNKEFFNGEQLKNVVKNALKQPFLMPNISEYQVT